MSNRILCILNFIQLLFVGSGHTSHTFMLGTTYLETRWKVMRKWSLFQTNHSWQTHNTKKKMHNTRLAKGSSVNFQSFRHVQSFYNANISSCLLNVFDNWKCSPRVNLLMLTVIPNVCLLSLFWSIKICSVWQEDQSPPACRTDKKKEKIWIKDFVLNCPIDFIINLESNFC